MTKPPPQQRSSGHVIFVNGIQNSGKSSVARRLAEVTTTFRVLTRDDVVRSVPESQRLRLSNQMFAWTIAMIDEWLQSSNVIVEGTLTRQQLHQVQGHYREMGLYIVLRIDEQERRRREAQRTDRQIRRWDPKWHRLPGPDELYDLVLDSKRVGIDECVARILQAARAKWPHIELRKTRAI